MSLVPVRLSDEQQHLFDYIESTQNHIFVTGRAGTGKSTLLSYFIENTHKSVGAQTATDLCVFSMKYESRVDLPVPARPVTKMWFWVDSM